MKALIALFVFVAVSANAAEINFYENYQYNPVTKQKGWTDKVTATEYNVNDFTAGALTSDWARCYNGNPWEALAMVDVMLSCSPSYASNQPILVYENNCGDIAITVAIRDLYNQINYVKIGDCDRKCYVPPAQAVTYGNPNSGYEYPQYVKPYTPNYKVTPYPKY